jgi:hypothetical protein
MVRTPCAPFKRTQADRRALPVRNPSSSKDTSAPSPRSSSTPRATSSSRPPRTMSSMCGSRVTGRGWARSVTTRVVCGRWLVTVSGASPDDPTCLAEEIRHFARRVKAWMLMLVFLLLTCHLPTLRYPSIIRSSAHPLNPAPWLNSSPECSSQPKRSTSSPARRTTRCGCGTSDRGSASTSGSSSPL